MPLVLTITSEDIIFKQNSFFRARTRSECVIVLIHILMFFKAKISIIVSLFHWRVIFSILALIIPLILSLL